MQLLMRISHLQGYGRVKRFISQYAIAPSERWEKYSSKWETWGVVKLWPASALMTWGSYWWCPLYLIMVCRHGDAVSCRMEVFARRWTPRSNSQGRIQPRDAFLGRARWERAWGTRGGSLCKIFPLDENAEELLILETPKVSGCISACLWGSNSSPSLPLRLLANIPFFR